METMPSGKQALIVEDDRDVATELQSLLKDLGFKVTTLEDLGRVAEAMEARAYQVALVNMTLPGMNWRRTIKTLKNVARSTTVIVMKRSPDEGDVRLALNSGAYVVMYRPLTPEQLISLISPKNDGLFVALRG